METQYGEGDAAKSQSIAENYITQGVVGYLRMQRRFYDWCKEMPSKLLEMMQS